MRVVETYEHGTDMVFSRKIKTGKGLLHQFGVGYEELQDGIGHYTTAIVEMSDGTVKELPVNLIKFKYPATEAE